MSISGIAPGDMEAAREHNTVLEAETAGQPDDEWCAQHGLLDPETCSDVAKHCNETKQAAKVVQVGPLIKCFLHRKTAPCIAMEIFHRVAATSAKHCNQCERSAKVSQGGHTLYLFMGSHSDMCRNDHTQYSSFSYNAMPAPWHYVGTCDPVWDQVWH